MAEVHRSFRRSALAVGLLCLALVILADWLFHQQPVGLTLGLFGLAFLAALTARSTHYLRFSAGRVALMGAVGLVLACFEEPGVLAVLLGIAGLMTIAVLNRGRWRNNAAAGLLRLGEFAIMVWPQPIRDLLISGRWNRNRGRGSSTLIRLTLAWSTPIVLTAVFLLLLWLANEIISIWMKEALASIRAFFADLEYYVSPGRLILWLIVGWCSWGLLRIRWRWRRAARIPRPVPATINCPAGLCRVITTATVVRCLVLFNALFAVQTTLDIIYLWCGADLPNGLTYAEYAHRGAYPLLATALLAAAFVLATFRVGSRTERSRLPRALVYLWLAQNVFLVVSAGWRLNLYVEAYTLTRLRLAAAIWMGIVALGLVWIVWRIVRRHSNLWLININTCTALLVLYACCFINFDGLIAQYNVRQCREMGNGGGPPLDVVYLHELGPEALPAFYRLIETVPESRVSPYAASRALQLEAQIERELRNWRGRTWRRSRLESLLQTGRPSRLDEIANSAPVRPVEFAPSFFRSRRSR